MSKIQEQIQKWEAIPGEATAEYNLHISLLAALDVVADELAGIRAEIAKANAAAEKVNALYKLD